MYDCLSRQGLKDSWQRMPQAEVVLTTRGLPSIHLRSRPVSAIWALGVGETGHFIRYLYIRPEEVLVSVGKRVWSRDLDHVPSSDAHYTA